MKIKICGLKIQSDALHAANAGADYLGIVMAQSSPRRASIDEARAILALDITQPRYLVFGYDDEDYIRETFAAVANAATRLQIMADHPQLDALLKLAAPELTLPSISASEMVNAAELERWAKYPLVLFDSHRKRTLRAPGEGQISSQSAAPVAEALEATIAGGTGKTFNPAHIAAVRRPYLFAGGLNPDNVAGIVTSIHPHYLAGIDVASGTEASPGIKDHDKVRRFIENAKRAAQAFGAQQ